MCFHSAPIVTFSAGTPNFKRHFGCSNMCALVQQLSSCPSLHATSMERRAAEDSERPADVTVKQITGRVDFIFYVNRRYCFVAKIAFW